MCEGDFYEGEVEVLLKREGCCGNLRLCLTQASIYYLTE